MSFCKQARSLAGFFHPFHKYAPRFFLFICLVWALWPAPAGFARTETPALWPHQKSDLPPDPAVVFNRLENGFRYVLLKNKEPKDRVSMHLNVQVGSIFEEDQQQGMAHFLEHMLFCGSTHFKPGELVKYFQSIGMQFGHDANARTGFYETIYDLLLPLGDADHLDKALLVMNDYAQGALLLPEEIERERKVVLAEMRTRDTSAFRTFLSTVQFELPDTRFIHRMPIGKKEVLETMGRDAIKTFYDTWYRPDNLILVMVGDFDTETAQGLIKKHFAAMAPRRAPGTLPEFGNFAHQGLKTFYHYEKEEGNTTVTIEVAKKISPLLDSSEQQKKRMIQEMAHRMVQVRLDEMMRTPGTPFTTARMNTGIHFNELSFAEISADCPPEKWEETLFRLEQTLRQALAFGFTPEELERVKKEIRADFDNREKDMVSRESQALARKILSDLNNNRVFQSPTQVKALLAPIAESLTVAEAFASLKQTWSLDHRLVLVTGNVDLGKTHTVPEASIADAYLKSTAVPVSPTAVVDQIAFPYLPPSKDPGEMIGKNQVSGIDVLQVDFKNNLRLNLKETDFNTNEVLISVAFGFGRSHAPDHLPGLFLVTQGVMNQSGLGKMTLAQLQSALAGKNTTLTFQVKEDTFVFEVKTTPGETDLAFELIKAHILDPGFRNDAFQLVQSRLNQAYAMQIHSVEGAAQLHGAQFFAGNDSRFGLPHAPAINAVTLSDVQEWMTPVLASSPMEVSVVGNFNSASVIQAASRCLGTLPARKPATVNPELLSGPVFPSGQVKRVPVDTKIPNALIIVAYPTDDIWDIHQTRVLSVLAEILSEKARVEIREKLGAAYSFHVFNQSGRAYKNYGKLQAVIQTDPDSVGLVVERMKTVAAELAKNGVGREDLTYALDPMITGIKDMMRKNGYWVNTVLTGSAVHPQQLDWSQTIMDDYAAITPKQVSDAAKRFLDNDKSAVFIAEPASR